MTTPDPSPRWTPETERLVRRAIVDSLADAEGEPRLTDEEWASTDPDEVIAAEDMLATVVRPGLTALADAGLLLPPGGETRTTWRVQWFGEDGPEGRIYFDDEGEARAYFASDEVTSRVVEGVWRAELQRRSVTTVVDALDATTGAGT